MRTPGGRVVLVALAAAGVLVGGKLATRHGPVGGSSAGAAHAATTAAAAATSGPAGLGSLSDRLARLPELRPGELHGTLVAVGLENCEWELLSLATLHARASATGVCAQPGALYGTQILTGGALPRDLRVLDLDGRQRRVIRVPKDLGAILLGRDGVVVCPRSLRSGRLLRFGGGTEVLRGCPISVTPLLFAGPDRRTIVDPRGRRIAALRTPLPLDALVSTIGDGVLAVGTSIYRGGRLLATFDEPGGIVLGASRDGRVALIGNGTGLGLFLYRNGVARPIDTALATHVGTVSPDGSRLLVQHGDRQLIELDAATLRPLARIELATAPDGSLDWLATGG
jgi:hypothetical protein